MLKQRLKQKAKTKAKQKVRSTAKTKVREAASKEDAPKVLKSAVGGGTAYQGGTHASPAGTVGAGAGNDTVAQLQQLAQLHDSGALTDEEFASAKQKLLAGG